MSSGEDDIVYRTAGEYVLGVLSAAERADVERRLASDGALRDAVRYWEAQLVPLTGLVDEEQTRVELWERIEHSLEHGHGAQRSIPQRWWDSLMFWRSLAGTAVAALALLLFLQPQLPWVDPPQPRFLVVLVAPDDKSPGWVVQASSRASVRLIPLGSGEIPRDKALQFWTKADSWKGPVSLGLVQPGRSLQVQLRDLPPIEANQLFEITLEPPAGSPIDRPTGPILFIGRAVPVI